MERTTNNYSLQKPASAHTPVQGGGGLNIYLDVAVEEEARAATVEAEKRSVDGGNCNSPTGGAAGDVSPLGVPATGHTSERRNTHDEAGQNSQVRNSIDIRIIKDRAKSKKFNRTSSHQCYVDIEGWLQAFPGISYSDLGPGFSTGSFLNAQGLRIATYSWKQNEAPEAAIVLFHSYTSYTLFDFLRHQPPDGDEEKREEEATWVQKYPGSWVEGFYRLGMNVYAMDHQSHGCSEGWRHWRCNVPRFEYLVNDALQFLNENVLLDPSLPSDVPVMLLGYSMGGNVVIQTLGRIFNSTNEVGLRARVNQAVLLAPLIKIKLDLKTEVILKINRSLISYWLPNMRLSRGDASVCPYLGWWYDRDPYAYSGRTKSRMVAALYDASRQVRKIMRKFPPHFKLLCLQGTQDDTVDFREPLRLYKSPVKLDLLYLCGWSHYLTKGHGADKLMVLIIAWVEKSTFSQREISNAAQLRLFSLNRDASSEVQANASR